jgi:RNA polymerase sigma-70 factor (ECF subfamily)
MSAWLFTILHNLFRSEYRKRRREVEDADGRHVDGLKSPPQQHSRLEFEEFRRALEKLLPGQRDRSFSSARQASPTRRPPLSASAR